jgi:hypothetical protein
MDDRGAQMKALSKAILEQDEQRKMKAKLTNHSYAPWKNPRTTVKETPFGNFPGEKKKPIFDFSVKKPEYVGEQASTNVCMKLFYFSVTESSQREES